MTAARNPKKHAASIVKILRKDYRDVQCALKFRNPLELLVATILSAQCTDERVNQVTSALFERYRSASDFAQAKLSELELAIHSTGFFRNKAKNIRACCQKLNEKFNGVVPGNLLELVDLPGVGRKTANVVLGTAFGIPSGVVVDTHVTRLSQRLGLTKNSNAEKIELDLIDLVPKREWIGFSHRLIWHGRRVCKARKPSCEECNLLKLCPQVGVA